MTAPAIVLISRKNRSGDFKNLRFTIYGLFTVAENSHIFSVFCFFVQIASFAIVCKHNRLGGWVCFFGWAGGYVKKARFFRTGLSLAAIGHLDKWSAETP